MININYNRDSLLTDFGKQTLKDRYLLPEETSPQEGFARAATAFSDSPEMAQRIYDYASKLWVGFSTPILSNAPVRLKGWEMHPENFSKQRGMPISCFLNYVEDSREGITSHYTENAWLASMGGGIGGSWSDVRSDGAKTKAGSKSSGVIPFMGVVDREMLAFSQGMTRRGSYAAFLDISHPEIVEFIGMRKPTGGDINRKNLNLHHGVCISDEFMEIIEDATTGKATSTDWHLIDPNSGDIVQTVCALELWQRLLETRHQTGEPYIVFSDTVNNALPIEQQLKGLKVHHSNLCVEITLPTDNDRTAVCCLSSVNLERYDEWKSDPLFISDMVRFLDNVLTFFILNAPESMAKAIYSAAQERSIGLGAMGWHSYLQSKGIPFESVGAALLNERIFKGIHASALAASRKLSSELGAAPDMGIGGLRNAHLIAIAPNASSSVICGGASPSIEPIKANIFTHKTLSGSFKVKNKYLDALLWQHAEARNEYKGELSDSEWVAEQWKSIGANRGSVQHLSYISAELKEVFKTALEIDQNWVIKHAAERQPYICQSQSLNLFVPSNVDIKHFHMLHLDAWRKGVKTLYYCRSESLKKAENIGLSIERTVTPSFDEPACLGCE
ncbi:ribonucleotide-diphosphate reductase subunit alpha [Nitrincola sp. A-D6]|uniref:ribonucleoside-diphosphate reductase subunit alpha n=1 Tax=Nitrincola sp. A-D6 TaxID=1545442 RepID=UPI00051FBA03|nr:ribonucleoside-diphosphate reductase subunit alpha [Nitrincola sp. A-D6]KGK41218.1 ribonucleotide-diphosphate reductase subunit alpha [Nitrincola sp. A-D6]